MLVKSTKSSGAHTLKENRILFVVLTRLHHIGLFLQVLLLRLGIDETHGNSPLRSSHMALVNALQPFDSTAVTNWFCKFQWSSA